MIVTSHNNIIESVDGTDTLCSPVPRYSHLFNQHIYVKLMGFSMIHNIIMPYIIYIYKE